MSLIRKRRCTNPKCGHVSIARVEYPVQCTNCKIRWPFGRPPREEET